MQVDPVSIKQCKDLGLIKPPVLTETLLLSLPSMSLNREMRWYLHRAMVGDSAGWAASGVDAHLGANSIETLTSVDEPMTWTKKDWSENHQEIETALWGNRLTSLSFTDDYTA